MIRRTVPRGGFTLVEILVVIAIIAILVSLVSVVAVKVQRTARRTAASAEMAQVANAIGAFKAKMNVGFIPSGGSGPNGTFQLKATYAGNEFEAVYLKMLFPGMDGCNGAGSGTTGLTDGVNLDPNQTLVFFLTGGSNVINGTNPNIGFSTNRRQPFEQTATNRIGPFIEFPANKYAQNVSSGGTGAAFSLVDPWGSPYAYFAFNPMNQPPGYVLSQSFTFNGTTVQPYVDNNNKALNPRTFQLISAGENGKDDPTVPPTHGFGPGGYNTATKQSKWTPQANEYAEGMSGADDLSNFNSGPLVTNKD